MNELLRFHLTTGPTRHEPPKAATVTSKMHSTQPTRDLPALLGETHIPRFHFRSTPMEPTHFISLQEKPPLFKPAKPPVIQGLLLPQQSGPHDPRLLPSIPKQRIIVPAQFDLRAKSKFRTSLVLKWNELPEQALDESREKYILTISLMTLQNEVVSEEVVHLSKNTHTVDHIMPNMQYMVTVKSPQNPHVLSETIVYPRRKCEPRLAHIESTHINQ